MGSLKSKYTVMFIAFQNPDCDMNPGIYQEIDQSSHQIKVKFKIWPNSLGAGPA